MYVFSRQSASIGRAAQGAVMQLWRYAVAPACTKDQPGELSTGVLQARWFAQGLEVAERALADGPSAKGNVKL
jgi:hypothetical protein